MKFPTGGKAREPRGMIRCNSEARQYSLDERRCKSCVGSTLVMHSKALK